MSDLIERETLLSEIAKYAPAEYGIVSRIINRQPTVDAKKVVECKDCKYYKTIHCTCDGCCISDMWYCADGERK